MMAKLQIWLFEKGSSKDHMFWESLGNLTQDIRTKLNL